MSTAFLLMTLTCSTSSSPLPVAAMSAALACGGWGDKSAAKAARAAPPSVFDRWLGSFRRKHVTTDGLPGVGTPVQGGVAPAPGTLPAQEYQPFAGGGGLPAAQGQTYPGWRY